MNQESDNENEIAKQPDQQFKNSPTNDPNNYSPTFNPDLALEIGFVN